MEMVKHSNTRTGTLILILKGNTVPTKSPMSWAGKWTQNVWGAFSIIYLAAYTANLTSSIADGVRVYEFRSIRDQKVSTVSVLRIINFHSFKPF